jgi:hypothetical protein
MRPTLPRETGTFVGYRGDSVQAHYEASRTRRSTPWCATGWASEAEKARLSADTAVRFYRLRQLAEGNESIVTNAKSGSIAFDR